MITPRWYQEEAIQSIYNYFMHNSGNPLIGLPGGTGKSIIPAIFIHRVMQQWGGQRFLLITHIKELIEQNAEKVKLVWPTAPLGIHSAGLKQRDYALPVIFGGIQSMSKNPAGFGHRDIIFIDEAHLVSQDDSSMYMTFLATMKLINPRVKIIGMTATPFRMGQGMLTDGGLFTDMCYDMTDMKGFNRLTEEGYLAKLIPKRTHTELDTSDVSVVKGEFVASQLEKAVDKQEITYAALKEVVNVGHDRRSWLLFATGIEHSNHIAEMLNSFGIDCASVHSKQKADYNDRAIKAFKTGELRAIVNYGKLTTGFDNPIIDLIADLRPTLSVPLHVQKYCRGTRPADGKLDCMVLDFAKNVPRLGCINDPIIPRKKGEAKGEPPVKICEECGTYNYASARTCCNCGHEFAFKVKIFKNAGNDELVRSDTPIIETFDVQRATYQQHQKAGSPPILKVIYNTGIRSFNEWVCLEHNGFAKKIARDWWRKRHRTEPPETVAAALDFVSHLRVPKKIKVHVNKKHAEIVGVEW